MTKILINKSLQIEPIPHESFISTNRTTYEEVGILVAKDESITDIPIGARIFFSSWMAEKYPDLDHTGKWLWVVPYSEIKMYEFE